MRYRISRSSLEMVKYLLGRGDKLGAVKFVRSLEMAPDLYTCKCIVDKVMEQDTFNFGDYTVVAVSQAPKPPQPRYEMILPRMHNYALVVLDGRGTISMKYDDTLAGSLETALELSTSGYTVLSYLENLGGYYEPYEVNSADMEKSKDHFGRLVDWCKYCGGCKCHECECDPVKAMLDDHFAESGFVEYCPDCHGCKCHSCGC